jgi:hypothetical protein
MVLSAGLLIYLFTKIDIAELRVFFHSLPLKAVIWVLFLGFLNASLQGLRFLYAAKRLLPPFGFRQALVSHFSGFLFRLILPASLGEVGKAFLLPGTNKTRIFTFLIDAFFTTGILFFCFGIATYLLYPGMWYMLGFCVVFIVLFLIYRLLEKQSNFQNYIPDTVPYLHIGCVNIGLTLLSYLAFIGQYWVLLHQYGISFIDQAKVCFFILGFGAIPLSFAGLGFRENAAHLALRSFGVPSGVAVGTALFIFFINVILPALAGVVLLSFFSDIRYSQIRDMARNLIRQEKTKRSAIKKK